MTVRCAILRLFQSHTTSTRWPCSHWSCGISVRSNREIENLHRPSSRWTRWVWVCHRNCSEFGKESSKPWSKVLHKWTRAYDPLTPSERENAMDYIRALDDVQPTEERALASTKGVRCHEEAAQKMKSSWSTSMKSTTERILSAGLIRMNPMHSGHEVFLMQGINFSRAYEPR